jgi:phage terminase large subunit-like protein
VKQSERIIDFVNEFCCVPEGKLVGQQFELRSWQIEVIERIYDNPAGTRRAIISYGRKNGKTAFAALLLLAHLCGPASVQNGQLYSAAMSRDQASLIFNLASKIIRQNVELASMLYIKEAAKEIWCPDRGTKYKALSAESSTAYGLSPAFIIHDELGQVRGPRSPLYDALETATGAQEDPLSVIISTQAPNDADLLSVLIDNAEAGHDPHTVLCLYSTPVDLNPFSQRAIKEANPALGDFLSLKEVQGMADDAKRMPALEARFRNLILNQRVNTDSPFVQPMVWKACAGPVDVEGMKRVPIYAGLDLSEVQDLTALVLIGKIGDKWHVLPTFWLPQEGLAEKAVRDRVPYDKFVLDGTLQTTPGKTVSYEYVAKYIKNLFEVFDIRKIGFDRYNMRHLTPWLEKAGFNERSIEDHFIPFGQGMQSMSPALRDLEQILVEGNLVHGGHEVLTMCVANATIVIDDAGNRKPSKKKSTGRIDGLVSLAMACGVAPLQDRIIDVETLIG